MTQIDAMSLDHSPFMRQFFEAVRNILIETYATDRRSADALVDRYFSLDVDPLERALAMHRMPEDVARDLAGKA
jgi:hypothetical protein